MKTIAEQLKIKDFPFEIKDKDGNKIYYEHSNGYWHKIEYKDGNKIYYEHSDGFWWKSEYKDGNEIYFEKSNGYWFRSEYKDGNQIYYENSDGEIVDNRPKETTEMTIADLEKLTGIKNLKIVK